MTEPDPKALRQALKPYQQPRLSRSLLELAVTAVPFLLAWTAVFVCVSNGWWAGLLLAPVAAFFLVRLFMIQHDCGHQAFFESPAANAWVGRTLGVLNVTPYEYWRRTHAIHHATSGDLDRRDLGAIETLTVAEYRAAPPLRRLAYRFYRHPAVLLGLGPAYMFVLQHRLPIGVMRQPWAWGSVMGTNLALLALALPFALAGALPAFLITQASVVVLAATIGVWLFYVQHQFEETWWSRRDGWSAHEAALKGSSHLVLPQPFRWLTADIGLHHLHHLSSRIPFYRLAEVLRREPLFAESRKVGVREAFASLGLALWDERQGRLVSFGQVRAARRAALRHAPAGLATAGEAPGA